MFLKMYEKPRQYIFVLLNRCISERKYKKHFAFFWEINNISVALFYLKHANYKLEIAVCWIYRFTISRNIFSLFCFSFWSFVVFHYCLFLTLFIVGLKCNMLLGIKLQKCYFAFLLHSFLMLSSSADKTNYFSSALRCLHTQKRASDFMYKKFKTW